jgi:hypothetical protein
MMFTKALSALAVALVAQTGLVSAAPTVQKRDVYVPKVLYPHSGVTWTSGQTHNVTW